MVLWRIDEVLSVKDLNLNNIKVLVTPNPASEFIQIVIENRGNSQTSIKLFNEAGQQAMIIYEGNVAEKMTFTENVSRLPNGKYFLNVYQNGQITTQTIMIQK